MTIYIKWRGRVFSITFGRDHPWCKSLFWITVIEEFYDSKCQLQYASWIKGIFKERKEE